MARKGTKDRIKIPRTSGEPLETRMSPLTEQELANAVFMVRTVRERITAMGGDASETALDDHGSDGRDQWAKRLLKFVNGAASATRWSYNDVKQLRDALWACERTRVIEALSLANSINDEKSLRMRYELHRASAIAGTRTPTSELFDGRPVPRGGAIPLEYEAWIAANADPETSRLLDTLLPLNMRQVISDARYNAAEVATLPMLYVREHAASMAAQLARL
jgi:hypothetical protein